MLDPMEATRRWKTLLQMLNKISDPMLKESMLAMFRSRAIEDWGFCPDNSGKVKPYDASMLPPMQSLIYEKLQSCKDYGVWEQDPELDKACLNKMLNLIDRGYTYFDLPDYLQCPTILDLYLKALDIWVEQQEKILK